MTKKKKKGTFYSNRASKPEQKSELANQLMILISELIFFYTKFNWNKNIVISLFRISTK